MSDHDQPSGTRWIWNVFWLLLIVTAVEVALGIIKPGFMMKAFGGTIVLNYVFIILTLVKAYYIVMYFMHLKYEAKTLIWSISLPVLILIPYLTFIVLVEAGYMNEVTLK
ncbi:MAG: cytochrome C oxidase subunit IV family protein [Cryomorphaceae bacterium]|nr:cytochrome C oxidase subunit IV family protein [Cryomorphaceae bacterium]